MLFENISHKSVHSFRYFVITLITLTALAVPLVVRAETRYISDQLNVPIRSGASNQYRIIKFLTSGTALKVLGTSDDGKYYHVEIPGEKDGWVLADNVMDIPSGRARLETANKRLETVRDENSQLKDTIKSLRSELSQIKGENKSLQTERTNLSNSLDDLKITAANPIALSKKNRQLKDELDNALNDVKMLQSENDSLRNNVMQEWFIIGGSTAIGSLILGIILTRIPWRRKRNSWGDSF
jgi:SH3 domain protein